jgi:hypothetical protein
MTAKKPAKQPWDVEAPFIYMGRRTKRGGGILYAWRTDTGEEIVFSKGRSLVVGGTYLIKTDNARSTMWGEPKWDSEAKRHDSAPKWDAIDASAYQADKVRILENRLNSERPYKDMTLAQLQRLFRRQSTNQRTAMIALIIRYLSEEW